MGRQFMVAVMNFVGFWVIGVVLGYVLTFSLGLGLPGLWWGLAAGLTSVAAFGAVVVARTDWEEQVHAVRKRLSVSAKDQKGDAEAFDAVVVEPPMVENMSHAD